MGRPLSRQHVPALDGVRGLAIVLVLAFHGANSVLPDLGGWVGFARHVVSFGATGVDLFFVLSGYLITGILLDSRDEGGYFRNFYGRRALRIFPAYYLYLALIFGLLEPLARSSGYDPWAGVNVWYYLFYLQNWMPNRGVFDRFLNPMWSLAIEEQFYLVWPALVYLLPRRAVAPVCVAGALGALALRCTFDACGWHPEDAHRLTPARLDTLMFGALLALAVRDEGWLRRCKVWLPRTGCLALAGVITADVVIHRWPRCWFLENTFMWTFAAVVYAALVFAAATGGGGRFGGAFRWGWLRSFGRYSYGIYIYHSLVMGMLASVWPGFWFHSPFGLSMLGGVAFPLALAAGSYALALLSWHLLEKRFLRLKGWFRYTGAPADGAS
jgi:peptidoglycan/LPS O-acetylase OafA/YrhL